MVASITPILEPNMPRAQTRAGGRNTYSAFDFCAHVDSMTSTAPLTKQTPAQSEYTFTNCTGTNLNNQPFSITAITNSTGAISERYAYTAYGQPTILDASGSILSTSSISNRYTYTGREWDATLGLYHFRARWMSPSAGRFLGRDPIGYVDGNNFYMQYFGLAETDPNGLRKVCCKFRYGWIVSQYTTKEIECGEGKSAEKCCKNYAAFPNLWAVIGAFDQACGRVKNPGQQCLLKPVTTVTTVATTSVKCGKTFVTLHPATRVGLVLVCLNEHFVNDDPSVQFPGDGSPPPVNPPKQPQDPFCNCCEIATPGAIGSGGGTYEYTNCQPMQASKCIVSGGSDSGIVPSGNARLCAPPDAKNGDRVGGPDPNFPLPPDFSIF
jgi:RHS repeat-associated protein